MTQQDDPPWAPPATFPAPAPVAPLPDSDDGEEGEDGDQQRPPPFVRPELIEMGPPTTVWLVGRFLLVVAALLVGLAAQRTAGAPTSAEAQDRGASFWPVVASAGVMVVVSLAATVIWSWVMARNARLLKTRSAPATAMARSWLAPTLWVVLSATTYLRVQVDGDLDPLPGLAGLGFVVAMLVPYGRLQGVLSALSRRAPKIWFPLYAVDTLAFGMIWWRLTSWPDPATLADSDTAQLTASVSFAAAGLLVVGGVAAVWTSQRATSAVYERLGRLEARHRKGDEPTPEWFAAGVTPSRDSPVASIESRPLMHLSPLTGIVALLHVLWGVSIVALSVVLVRLAFRYADETVVFGETLRLSDSDTDRVTAVTVVVGLVYVATIVAHGAWAVLVAFNARRVTVHAPSPGGFGLLFLPMPILVVTGFIVGGDVGYWFVIAGLAVAFFVLIIVNRMLAALSARLDGSTTPFSRWTAIISAVYLVGVVSNLLFSQAATGRLGFAAATTIAQGAFIILGGVVGYRAMADLETTLRLHRQIRRSGSARSAIAESTSSIAASE